MGRKIPHGASAEASALREAVSARVVKLRAALLAAGMADPRDALLIAGLPPALDTPAPHGSAKFLARADCFLTAVGLSLDNRRGNTPDDDLPLEFLSRYVEFVGTGQVHTLAQLRYLESDLLTYWNEASPARTHRFWEAVQRAQLPYERVDYLDRIMGRGRISSRTEYDYAVDSIVGAQQEGRLSAADATRLATMIGAYEQRRR